MKKKTLCILLVLLVCVLVLLVGFFQKFDFTLYKKIGFCQGGGEADCDLVYNGTVYHYVEDNRFDPWRYHGELVKLSWHWYFFPLLAVTNYYSDSAEDPDFIYCLRAHGTWLKDGYDYTEQLFRVQGTDYTIRFSDAYYEDRTVDSPSSVNGIVDLYWAPAEHEALVNWAEVHLIGGRYYIQFAYDEPGYEIREDFLENLFALGIIS